MECSEREDEQRECRREDHDDGNEDAVCVVVSVVSAAFAFEVC